MKKIEKARLVKIYDYREFDGRFCCNGGDYGYTTYFHRIDESTWLVEYDTTAEFPFSKKYGNFCSPEELEAEEDDELFPWLTVHTDELISILKEAQTTLSEFEKQFHYNKDCFYDIKIK